MLGVFLVRRKKEGSSAVLDGIAYRLFTLTIIILATTTTSCCGFALCNNGNRRSSSSALHAVRNSADNGSDGTTSTRRAWISTTATAVTAAALTASVFPAKSNAAAPLPAMEGLGGKTESMPRVEGTGGGYDVRRPLPATAKDVGYPDSIVGPWTCERTVTLIEGDEFQARVAWSSLGGRDESLFRAQKSETFATRYIKNQGDISLDRGFEIESRSGGNSVVWDAAITSVLSYQDSKGQKVELAIVERQAEPPTDEGFGFNELVRISSASSSLGVTERVARVKRRYRRAFDADGNRVVEGLEIMKTYRVLDGIAGELPTSTTKTKIRMTRPQ